MTASTTSGTSEHRTPELDELTRRIEGGARRFGYVMAAACNAVLLWLVHQLLDWGWPGFLTEEFDRVLPWVTVSLVVSMVANLWFAVDDRTWRKPLGELVSAVAALASAWRTWVVFPFEFTGTDWSWLVRTVLVVGIVGMAIGIVVHSSRLVGQLRDRPAAGGPSDRSA